jgi:hypothetical protein
VATNVKLVTGRDEAGQPANVGVGMDENGLLLLSTPGANLSNAKHLRRRIWQAIQEEFDPKTADALTSKVHGVIVDHFMKLGAREIRLDPDAAQLYQKFVRAVNNIL